MKRSPARTTEDRFRRIVRENFGADAIALRSDGLSDADAALLVGYMTPFSEWTEIRNPVEGHFLEQIRRGAFAKTFRERKPKVLFQHGTDPVVGKQVLGVPKTLREDTAGAYYEVGLFDGIPPLLLAGLRAGAYGASFRFEVVAEEYVSRPKKSSYNPRGLPERTITEARVFEFGPVTFPAYPSASAVVGKLPRSRTLRTQADWRLT
jgi:HK97 family phage prohead protease